MVESLQIRINSKVKSLFLGGKKKKESVWKAQAEDELVSLNLLCQKKKKKSVVPCTILVFKVPFILKIYKPYISVIQPKKIFFKVWGETDYIRHHERPCAGPRYGTFQRDFQG